MITFDGFSPFLPLKLNICNKRKTFRYMWSAVCGEKIVIL